MSATLRPEDDTAISDEPLGVSGDRELAASDAHVSERPRERIAGRYRVERTLGRGGMAVVYQVEDSATGRSLALKQMVARPDHRHYDEMVALFEREYHTLVQLSHPRIVAVYDFGLDGGPYYTMELLEGGDLRERAPLPWKEASALILDVCSTLALLHSRRLVHRDVSPRNVRSTSDGTAKLIDFGALAPMGPNAQVVGTPPFVPPEVLHRSALDARTDLYSLGATFYYVLTGRLAYPARDFSSLSEAWASRPPPPSSVVAGIPPALDALVMSLIALDPAVRPRGAFEVMQRLSGIADLPLDELLDVSQAYLSMPLMVGREDTLTVLRKRIKQALAGRGGALLLEGPAGIGRSRMLDAGSLEAKIAGATVLRANASLADHSLALWQSLCEQLVEELPEATLAAAREEQLTAILFESGEQSAISFGSGAQSAISLESGAQSAPGLRALEALELDRAALQNAICRLLFRVCASHPLVMLVDDLHKADDASLALLAALGCVLETRRILLVATRESGAVVRADDPLQVLSRYALSTALQALHRVQTESLLGSLFGDVPHLALLSDRIFRVAAGNPRETMELAQWLVNKGLVRYQSGSWSLPSRLELSELPHDLTEAFAQRLASLSAPARYFVEAHALSIHPTLARDDYARLAVHAGLSGVDELIAELLAQQIVRSEGHGYVLSHRGWADAAGLQLDAAARSERHRALAALYDKGEAFRIERAHHLLCGGRESLGLDLVLQTIVATQDTGSLARATTLPASQIAPIFACALDSAEVLPERPLRDAFELRRALASLSIQSDDAYYLRVRPAWFERLRQDSGLAYYEALAQVASPQERLMQALTRAAEVYQNTPEAERVYSPEAAIKGLVYYTVVTIALGSRMQASELLMTLPEVLAPFVPLSPVIDAICKNALATCESNCLSIPERALLHWGEVQALLANVTDNEMPYVAAVRSAIWYGIGNVEARLGMKLADERAKLLDQDIMQQVSAMSLRKITRLHQGDFEGAERCRKRGEALALQSPVRQMFSSTIVGELIAYALASDLVGLRQLGDAIKPLAARHPGWVPYQCLADGYFEQTRGQLGLAREALERGLALSEPDEQQPLRGIGAWPRLEAAYIEVLLALGHAEQAKTRGERAVALCTEYEVDVAAFSVRRALALVEGKLGAYEQASARLEAVVLSMNELGITGLELGATYEARARIAIWAEDNAAIEHFGQLTAKEYRHGERSPLGARYERLMDEARNAGVDVLPQLTDFQTKLTTAFLSNQRSATAIVAERMSRADTRQSRLACALSLLCESRLARAGQLYLQGERGLELAASHGAGRASAEEQAFVRRYFAAQLETADTATVLSKGEDLPALTVSQWLAPDGVVHYPLLLIGDADGSKSCAGVALLELSDRTATEVSALQLSNAVASYLLMVGDARPVRTKS